MREPKTSARTTTNDEGIYVFAALTPGEYAMKVEAAGFKTTEQQNIAVETSTTRALDVAVEVGSASRDRNDRHGCGSASN
jgi:hypothetical protein